MGREGGRGGKNSDPKNLKKILFPVQADTEEFIEAIKVFRPHAFVSMCDEVGVYASNSSKRAQKAVSRSSAWLSKINSGASATRADVIASIQGIADEQSRIQSVKSAVSEAKKENSRIAGYCFGGFGGGESPSRRSQLLLKCIETLEQEEEEEEEETCRRENKPKGIDRPRMVCGQDSPLEILQCVSMGFDLFDGPYPFLQAEFGHALVFNLDPDLGKLDESFPGIAMNMRDPCLSKDKRAIFPGCGCRTCRMHTRGYVHHLHNTQEMLAEVLLSM